MQINNVNPLALPQDCHDLISKFIHKHQNGTLSPYNQERVSQEVTEKVIDVMNSIYNIFDSMHNVLYEHEYESDFFFPDTTIAHLTLSEVNLINQVSRRVFHGTVEVKEISPSESIYPFKMCESIFHKEIFKMTTRSRCTIKCTMNLEQEQILKPLTMSKL